MRLLGDLSSICCWTIPDLRIIEVVTTARYSDLEERIRFLGFGHDMREGAPRCRWVPGDLTVDIMPTEGAEIGLNTAWFKEALATATERKIARRVTGE